MIVKVLAIVRVTLQKASVPPSASSFSISSIRQAMATELITVLLAMFTTSRRWPSASSASASWPRRSPAWLLM